VNRLSFRRTRDGGVEIAVPVVDRVPLYVTLPERFPGIAMSTVAPPSRHLLGAPVYVEDERTVLLDGWCGVAGCCGVMARITVDRTTVIWSDFFARGLPELPPDLRFAFDRWDYEQAISRLQGLIRLTSNGRGRGSAEVPIPRA